MDPEKIRQASSTSFKGNLNGKLISTSATNWGYTFLDTGKVDRNGNPVYQGSDVDIMGIVAQAMNFTVVYGISAPVASSGSRLPNGTWTSLVGKARPELLLLRQLLALQLVIVR
jgi:hypothetical protein